MTADVIGIRRLAKDEVDKRTKGKTVLCKLRRGYVLRIGDQVEHGPLDISLAGWTAYQNIHKMENVREIREFVGLPLGRNYQTFDEVAVGSGAVRRHLASRGGASPLDDASIEKIAAATATATVQALVAAGVIPSGAQATEAADGKPAEAAGKGKGKGRTGNRRTA